MREFLYLLLSMALGLSQAQVCKNPCLLSNKILDCSHVNLTEVPCFLAGSVDLLNLSFTQVNDHTDWNLLTSFGIKDLDISHTSVTLITDSMMQLNSLILNGLNNVHWPSNMTQCTLKGLHGCRVANLTSSKGWFSCKLIETLSIFCSDASCKEIPEALPRLRSVSVKFDDVNHFLDPLPYRTKRMLKFLSIHVDGSINALPSQWFEGLNLDKLTVIESSLSMDIKCFAQFQSSIELDLTGIKFVRNEQPVSSEWEVPNRSSVSFTDCTGVELPLKSGTILKSVSYKNMRQWLFNLSDATAYVERLHIERVYLDLRNDSLPFNWGLLKVFSGYHSYASVHDLQAILDQALTLEQIHLHAHGPKSLSGLNFLKNKRLTELNMISCAMPTLNFSNIPPSVHSLRVVDGYVRNIIGHPRYGLKLLDLSNNSLTSFTLPLSDSGVQYLDISYNPISSFANIKLGKRWNGKVFRTGGINIPCSCKQLSWLRDVTSRFRPVFLNMTCIGTNGTSVPALTYADRCDLSNGVDTLATNVNNFSDSRFVEESPVNLTGYGPRNSQTAAPVPYRSSSSESSPDFDNRITNDTLVSMNLGLNQTFTRASIGALFINKGHLLTSLDVMTLTFAVKLPELTVMQPPSIDPVIEICNSLNGSEVARVVCNTQLPIVKKIKAESEIEYELVTNRISDIQTLLPSLKLTSETATSRNKRFLQFIPLLGTILGGASKLVGTILRHKRMSALASSVNLLSQRQDLMVGQFAKLVDGMGVLHKMRNARLDKIGTSIKELNSSVSLIERNVQLIWGQMRNVTHLIGDNEVAIKLLATLNSQIHNKYMTSLNYYKSIGSLMDRLLSDLALLNRGGLSPTFLRPSVLRTMVDYAADYIHETAPHYKMVLDSIMSLYQSQRLVYLATTSPELGSHLMLQIGVYLSLTTQHKLNLFHIKTTHVPYSGGKQSDTVTTGYTLIKPQYEILAMSDSHYVRMRQSDLDDCIHFSTLNAYGCESPLLISSHSVDSCEKLLATSNSLTDILEHCDVRYLHSHDGPSSIFEYANHLLLSNIRTPVYRQCHGDTPVELNHDFRYALIPKSALCDCSLTSLGAFVPARLCMEPVKTKLDVIDIPNAVAVAALRSYLKINVTDEDLLNLKAKSLPELPPLNIEHEKSHDVMVDFGVHDETDFLDVIDQLKSGTKLYLDDDDRLRSELNSILTWFQDSDYWTLCLCFILSLIGSLAFIISIALCIKYRTASKTLDLFFTRKTRVPATD